MYSATTDGVEVTVEPAYLSEASEPDENHYLWAYTIQIINNRADTVQLRDRAWSITNESGHTEEVRGPGVVGEQPTLAPGESFTYTSGCPLNTPSGMMVGSYTMEDASGLPFLVSVPAFSLDIPDSKPVVN